MWLGRGEEDVWGHGKGLRIMGPLILSMETVWAEVHIRAQRATTPSRVFDEISYRENFAKLATKRFSCFAKIRDDFREFRSFAKLPRLRKKRFSRNTKIAKMKIT